MIFKSRAVRWGSIAFFAHTLFLLSVVLVESFASGLTLRKLHEDVIDRPAYELWWYLLNAYPRQLSDLTFPLANWLGVELFTKVLHFSWYLVVGAIPYVAVLAIFGYTRSHRQSARGA